VLGFAQTQPNRPGAASDAAKLGGTVASAYPTLTIADARYAQTANHYTKAESDARYYQGSSGMPIGLTINGAGNYALSNTYVGKGIVVTGGNSVTFTTTATNIGDEWSIMVCYTSGVIDRLLSNNSLVAASSRAPV
jgi:hypothetical protein